MEDLQGAIFLVHNSVRECVPGQSQRRRAARPGGDRSINAMIVLAAATAEATPGAGEGLSFGRPLSS